MLVDRERAWRDSRRLDRLLKVAKLKHPSACLEDVDYRPGRGIDKRLIATLGACDWVRAAQNLLLSGPTGVGKTWLACALGQAACRPGLQRRLPAHSAAVPGTAHRARGRKLHPAPCAPGQDRRAPARRLGNSICSTNPRAAICSRSSTIASARARPSSPANCRWISGTDT